MGFRSFIIKMRLKLIVLVMLAVFLVGGVEAVCDFSESENNDNFASSDYIDMQSCLNSQEGVNLQGDLSSSSDVDVYKIQGNFMPGDILDVQVDAVVGLRSVIGIFDVSEETLIINDHRNVFNGMQGPNTRLSLRGQYQTIYIAFAATPGFNDSGSYIINVKKLSGQRQGLNPQRVLLNFAGAQNVRTGNRPAVNVPPFDPSDISPVYNGLAQEMKELILARVRTDFKYYDVEIYSTEGEMPQPPYSTIYFGTL